MTRNWQLKLTAIVIAFLLWAAVQSGRPYRYRMTRVPVRVVNHDPEWVVSSDVSPAAVSIEFRGSFRDLLKLATAGVAIEVPVGDVSGRTAVYSLRSGWVDLGRASSDIEVGRIVPESVHVAFDRIATRLVAVRAKFDGALPDGYELRGAPVLDPAVVRVSGPAQRLTEMDTVDLPAIDLAGRRVSETVELMIDTTGLGVTVSPRRVRVALPVRTAVKVRQ
ncbi:MAG: YbbR-like domain-containing protein [Longimicrobiales bacterium]